MMDLLKKNLVSIICGVVALIAVGAIFWPISGYFDELRDRALGRARIYSELSGLETKQRNWPNVTLDQTAAVKPLDMFPTKQIIERGKALVEQIKAESGTMYKTAWEMNRHVPLTEGALPSGTQAALLSRFVTEYKQSVDVTKVENRATSRLVRILKGGFLPHNDTINAEKARKRQEINRRGIPGPGGVNINQQDLDDEYKIVEARVPGDLRREVAEKAMVYVWELSFDRFAQIANAPPNAGTPDLAHVWAAQVGLWLQEDICKSIANANEGAKSVIDAPIKQLLSISASRIDAVYKPANVGQTITPSEKADPAKEPPPNYLSSITGRAQCPLYDVVPFNVQLLVDATQVQRVMQALGRNKFITITTCNLESQDLSVEESKGYIMGTNPIVKLNMNCEALFLREWTAPLMPASIRRGLGLSDTEQPAP